MAVKQRIAMYSGPQGMMVREVGSFLLRHEIPMTTLTDKDIEQGALSGFPAAVFPGGGGPVMSKKAEKKVKDFVAGGGGFVGICASIIFAYKLRLLDFSYVESRGIGWYYIRLLERHPVTKGYRLANKTGNPKRWGADTVRISRVNGAYMIPGKGVKMIASYDNEKTLGAIIAGRYGKGEVVLLSPHAEFPAEPPPEWEWGNWQEPEKLLINAVEFIAEKGASRRR